MSVSLRIVAEGIEMTKFRFDFQDLIVLVGILRQPANRVAYSTCRQYFPERPPVIVLAAFTLLAHLSK